MTDTARKPMRAATWCAITTTVAIAVGAFVLSFAALRDLAHKAGQPPGLTWIWPILLDGSILQATVAVVALANNPTAQAARRFFWTVLAAAAAVSIAGNALHATISTGRVLPSTVAAAIATIAPIALLAATHGLTLLIRTPPAGDDEPADATDATPTVASATPVRHPVSTSAPMAHADAPEAVEGVDFPSSEGDAPVMRDRRILELFSEGWSARAIGREVQVHHKTVRRVIERTTSAPPMRHPVSTHAPMRHPVSTAAPVAHADAPPALPTGAGQVDTGAPATS